MYKTKETHLVKLKEYLKRKENEQLQRCKSSDVSEWKKSD